mmetsp:Transcript_132861/g.283928  ORF Transcript_132861/g.283928 Transcript_132861/m.283928 type:complete len:85 (-) Transcript_132861:270-524(-)
MAFCRLGWLLDEDLEEEEPLEPDLALPLAPLGVDVGPEDEEDEEDPLSPDGTSFGPSELPLSLASAPLASAASGLASPAFSVLR